jgi:ABC-2 type transport system ATP-binding protein
VNSLAAQGLCKEFEHVRAVDDVSVTLAPGEVRGLLGPNGAGKTTLLRLVLGLVRPDAGSIEIFGEPAAWAERPLSPLAAGAVEEPAFYPYLSARANLEVIAALDGAEGAPRIGALLERVGLGGDADRRVAGFSTGMRQRLGLACVLLRSPRLLILDEPTSGLDPAGMRFVERLVGELAADGVAILLSSHHISDIERVCDTFTVLRSGRVVWEGTREEMREQAPPAPRVLNTSDDERALSVAAELADVSCAPGPEGELVLNASEDSQDAFVLALAHAGVAVRRLDPAMSPLEAMYFGLTETAAASPTVGAAR